MTFVYPILLGGLIFAGIPVLLHFLVRQKPRIVPFPALRFLIQKQRSNTRNLRLRHLLLLLLRMALLAVLCLAVARPRLFHEKLGLSRERPVALILIFDTSPSMEYPTNEMTRLDLARKRALELLDQLPEDCRILIIDTAEPAQATREEWMRSTNLPRQKIQQLTLRAANGSVTRALEEALQRLEAWEIQGDDPAAQRYPRFLCVFTDRAQSSWEPGRVASLQKKLAREMPVPMKVLLFDVGIEAPSDLAITHLDLPRSPDGLLQQSFAEGEKIPLQVAVRGTDESGKSQSNTLICQVRTLEQQQSFEVQSGETQKITFEIDSSVWKLGPGFHQAEVKLATTRDSLTFNNQRFVTFEIRDRRQQRILVLTDEVKKAQTLARALEALLYPVEIRSIQEKTGPSLKEYAAVFLDGVAAPTEALWEQLTAYVHQGGGLGIIPAGDELQPAAYNSDAAQKIMPARILDKVSVQEPGSTWNVPEDAQHPFLRPYLAWLEHGRNDIQRLPRAAVHYWSLDPGKGEVIVRYDDDQSRPAVVERRPADKGAGKVLLLTTPMDEQKPGWNNYQSNLVSFYVGLTLLCTRHLVREAETPALNFQFGAEPPRVKQPPLSFTKYVLTGPDFSEEVRFDARTGFWTGERLQRAGNYTMTGANADNLDPRIIAQFSINIPGEESDLSKAAAADLEAVLGKESVIQQDRHTSLLETMPQYWNEPVELFPWLMILLLFLLALENLLSNRFYRQDAAASS